MRNVNFLKGFPDCRKGLRMFEFPKGGMFNFPKAFLKEKKVSFSFFRNFNFPFCKKVLEKVKFLKMGKP